MMENVDKLGPYVLKLFLSKRKHQLRYGCNGYITLPPRVDRMLHVYLSRKDGLDKPSFCILSTYDKIHFTCYICHDYDMGFSILNACPWTLDLPIHVLYRFKPANYCVCHVLNEWDTYFASDL